MTSCLLADASGLVALTALIPDKHKATYWAAMTTAVENAQLRFPKAVVAELQVLARNEPLAAWAAGLGGHLNQYKCDEAYRRKVMIHVRDAGYPAGFEPFDNKDPALAFVAMLACEYSDVGVDFAILTEDLGSLPLGPTAEALCQQAGWPIMKAADASAFFGLDAL